MKYDFSDALCLATLTKSLCALVTFAGSLGVLVTVQLLAALAIMNLVSRRDDPPGFLVVPLEGMFGRVLCLSDLPLVGQVQKLHRHKNIISIYI